MNELAVADFDSDKLDIVGALESAETNRAKIIHLLVRYLVELLEVAPMEFRRAPRASDVGLPPRVGGTDIDEVLPEAFAYAAKTAEIVLHTKKGVSTAQVPKRFNPREDKVKGYSKKNRRRMR